MSLYNEMRPSLFKEVKGQDKVVKILRDNLSSGHLPNAMLFVGTRGTGKTTVAKIVSKTINCEHPTEDGECCNKCASCLAIKQGNSLDVVELDAASNNGVDNVREIIQTVQFRPVGKKKIIILDEVHMLSTGAFNALLKVMEEPPKDVLFILCTTELQKIPATILSRCRKYQFETISSEMIVNKLKEVNEIYHLQAEDAALALVAKAAKGSMRDAESIYENFLDVENGLVTETIVRETLGYSSDELVFDVLDSIISGDPTGAFDVIAKVIEIGGNLVYLLEECFRILLDIIFVQGCGDISKISGNEDYLNKVTEYAFGVPMARLMEIADAFRVTYEKKGGNMELSLQGMIIALICNHSSIALLEQKVAELEQQVLTLQQNVTVPNLGHDTAVQTEYAPTENHVDTVAHDEIAEGVPDEEKSSLEDTDADKNINAPHVQVNENSSCTDAGFSPLNDDQIAELSALGFNMVEDAFTSDMVNAPTQESASVAEEEAEQTQTAEESPEENLLGDDFFGDFARLSEEFGFWNN